MQYCAWCRPLRSRVDALATAFFIAGTFALTVQAQADSITTTTLLRSESEAVEDAEAPLPPDYTAGIESFSVQQSCSVRFILNAGGDWASLRFIAVYDERHGRFAGPEENVSCTWTHLFEVNQAESHSGVLQVQASNPETFAVVHGPAEIGSCTFESDLPVAPTAFTLQVQESLTIVPVEIQSEPATVSVAMQCSGI